MFVRATLHAMDALSAVLASVRMQQMCWVSTVGRAPWGLSLPSGKCRVRFHYVVRGNAWLTVDKADEPRVALAGGDLAVMPHGHGHTLRDHPRSSVRSWVELATPSSQKAPGVFHVELVPRRRSSPAPSSSTIRSPTRSSRRCPHSFA